MMSEQPDTYSDWRSLWHSLAKELGWHITHNIRMGKPLMDRETWRLHCQMYRVHLRLEVEQEAKTDSWAAAFLQMLVSERGE
jgi:hypothetical protein